MHGWIVIDKPYGMGSTHVVTAVKRALRSDGYPKVKVGHGGTLDPLATGVLPIAVGEATKLAGRMLDASKIYDFTIAFGTQTDTLDLEGDVVATSDVRPTFAEIAAILPRFTGPISQVPPAYSAIKIDGKRAYDLARAGADVVMAARDVTIYALDIRNAERVSPLVIGVPASVHHRLITKSAPLSGGPPQIERQIQGEDALETACRMDNITLTAHVSKGTYIRSLARDIAHALGTVGRVTMLHRTQAGPFTLEQAISLDKLADAANRHGIEDITLPIRTALDDIPALALDPDQARLLIHGQVLSGVASDDGLYFAMAGETLIALVECSGGMIRSIRGFNL